MEGTLYSSLGAVKSCREGMPLVRSSDEESCFSDIRDVIIKEGSLQDCTRFVSYPCSAF
jgi:hypothetical protein